MAWIGLGCVEGVEEVVSSRKEWVEVAFGDAFWVAQEFVLQVM